MQTERRQLLQRNKSLGDELETATRQSALESGVTVLNAELTSTKEMFQKKVVSLSLERDEAVRKAQDKVVVLVRQRDEAISSADAATSRAAAVEATVAVLRAESEAACATNSRALAAARDSSSAVQRELVACRAAASASSSEQSTLLRAAQGKAAAAEQQATSLRVELDAYRAAHSSLRVELDAYRAAHSSSDEDVVAFKSAKDDALAAAADAAARATAAEQQASSLRIELDASRAAHSSPDEDAALKSEKDDALAAAADAAARATAAEQQVTSLQTELDARRADPAVNPFVRGSSARTRPTRTSSLDEDMAALKSEKDDALSAAADAAARTTAAEQQASSLRIELDASRAAHSSPDEDIAALKSEKDDALAAAADAAARATAAEQQASSLQSELDACRAAHSSSEEDIVALKSAKKDALAAAEEADTRAAAAEQQAAKLQIDLDATVVRETAESNARAAADATKRAEALATDERNNATVPSREEGSKPLNVPFTLIFEQLSPDAFNEDRKRSLISDLASTLGIEEERVEIRTCSAGSLVVEGSVKVSSEGDAKVMKSRIETNDVPLDENVWGSCSVMMGDLFNGPTTEDLEQLRLEISGANTTATLMRDKASTMSERATAAEHQAAMLRSAKDDALAAAADADARAAAAEQQASSLRVELDAYRAAHSSSDEDVAALKSAKDDALAAAVDADARATAVEQQATSLQTELDARRAAPAVNPFVRGSSARTRPTRTSSLDEDVASLKSEKDVALSAAADADARAVAAEHQAASLQAELDAFRRTQTQNTADEPLQSLSSPVFDGEVSMALALTTSPPNEEVAKLRAAKEDADARAAAAEQALARCDQSSVDLPDSAMMAKQLDHAELCAAKEDADARAAAAEQTLARCNQIMDLPDSAMMAKQLAQARAAEKDTAVIISTLQHEMDDLNARNVSVEKEDALAAAVTACASVAEQMSVSYRQTFEEKKVLLAASETAIERAEKAEEAAALLRSALEDATHGPPPLGIAASSNSLISLSTSGADSGPHAQQHDRDDDDDDDDDGDATSSDTLFLPLASTRDRNVVLIEPAADELPRVAEAPAPSVSHHSALSEIEDATHGPPPLGIAASSHSLVSLSTSDADSEFRAKQHDRDDDDEDDDDCDATSSDTIFLPPALTRDRDVMLIDPAADELPRVAEAPAPSILHHWALSEIDQKGFEASTLPFLNQEALEHAPNHPSNDETDSSVGSFSSCEEEPPPPGNGAEYDSDRDSADTSVCASVGVDASKSNDTADYLRQRERARALIERASSSPTATPATENRVE